MSEIRELREQVAAHIEDAVGPDASDEEIAAVLRGLGPAPGHRAVGARRPEPAAVLLFESLRGNQKSWQRLVSRH